MDGKENFFKALKSLKTDSSNPWPIETKGSAPHKPFLLLSVLDGIDQGWINSRKITLSENLKSAFEIYWDAIIGKERSTKVSIPFKHLAGKPFDTYWEVIDMHNASLNAEIYEKLRDKPFRIEVRHILLQEYFSPEAAFKISELSEMSSDAWSYSIEIDQMTEKPFLPYHNDKEKRTIREVSQQVREAGFSLKVRDLYNHSCAICRSRVVTPYGKTLVEGAHIIPWSKSYNDDPRNGISLCRNHHWLFDRYLISLRDNFTVVVSPFLLNASDQSIQLESVKDRKITLPTNPQYHPALEAIHDHRTRFKRYYLD